MILKHNIIQRHKSEMEERGNCLPTPLPPVHAQRSSGRLEHLVVDSVAFIKQPSLQDYGAHIYSVTEVVAEIRDEATRMRLSFLPYKLDLRQPDSASVKTVVEFARKSGDIASLSATDLKLIALTLRLTKEIEGDARCIRTSPTEVSTVRGSPFTLSKGATQIAGFHRPSSRSNELLGNDTAVVQSSDNYPLPGDDKPAEKTQHDAVLAADSSDSYRAPISPDENSEAEGSEGDSSDESARESGSEADSNDGDWITPDNLHEAISKMSLASNGDVSVADSSPSVRVACMTGDYAMQNVLVQMGLSVVSVDGMLITKLRQWVLRCYGCFHVTSDFNRKFCPKCGNMTLKRVSYTIDEQGQRVYYISKRRTLNLRGTKYSLPTPHGGKHPHFPILREDQRQAQNRPTRKALQKVNPLEENYVARDSPFAEIDLYSRAAMLGITGRPRHGGVSRNAQGHVLPDRRKNPNEARRKRK